MLQPLTRAYLQDHMSGEPIDPGRCQPDTAAEFAKKLVDRILSEARDQLVGDSDRRTEMTLTTSITLRAVDTNQALGGCVEVCVDFKVGSVCYHRNFKGKWPGKG